MTRRTIPTRRLGARLSPILAPDQASNRPESALVLLRVCKIGKALACLRISWLRASGIAEMPQVDQRVGHQFHPIVPGLFELKTQQKPLELVLPREGSLHA